MSTQARLDASQNTRSWDAGHTRRGLPESRDEPCCGGCSIFFHLPACLASTSSTPQKTMSFRQLQPALRAAARSCSQQPAKRSYSILSTRAPRLAQSVALKSALNQTQSRGVRTLDFAGTKEVVYERADWPASKLQEYFKVHHLSFMFFSFELCVDSFVFVE